MTDQAKTPEQQIRDLDYALRSANSALQEEKGLLRTRVMQFGIGALAVGFLGGWIVIAQVFGWMSAGSAEEMAEDSSVEAVTELAVAVLRDKCVEAARADPDTAKLVDIAAMTSENSQITALVNGNWIVVDGYDFLPAVKRVVADACRTELFPEEEANAAPTSG